MEEIRMAVAGVFLEDIEILTRSSIEIQPYKADGEFMAFGINSGNFRFTDVHIYKILKEFEKDELQEIFNKLKEDGYV